MWGRGVGKVWYCLLVEVFILSRPHSVRGRGLVGLSTRVVGIVDGGRLKKFAN